MNLLLPAPAVLLGLPAVSVTPPPDDLPAKFLKMNSIMIDANGIRLPQAIAKMRDGTLTIIGLDGAGGPLFCYAALAQLVRQSVPVELVFGLDRYCLPDQGTELCDVLSVHHYRFGHGWRYGIIEYQHKPRVVKPIAWDHPWWTERLNRETLSHFRNFLGNTSTMWRAER